MLKSETTAPIANNSSEVQSKQTYLEPQMVHLLAKTFKNEENYVRMLSNLWRVRAGLVKLTEAPCPNPEVVEMRTALNDIIGCLLPQDVRLLNEIQLKASVL
ncbi:hypothetical protein [Riemerella columbina]|uniref:hypothetical protein n=1 Tax=Riemerella columbina TaxID=103810 RepID=UPI00036F1F34|nr:hypothetical protein [Riemerella columbina]